MASAGTFVKFGASPSVSVDESDSGRDCRVVMPECAGAADVIESMDRVSFNLT